MPSTLLKEFDNYDHGHKVYRGPDKMITVPVCSEIPDVEKSVAELRQILSVLTQHGFKFAPGRARTNTQSLLVINKHYTTPPPTGGASFSHHVEEAIQPPYLIEHLTGGASFLQYSDLSRPAIQEQLIELAERNAALIKETRMGLSDTIYSPVCRLLEMLPNWVTSEPFDTGRE